MAAGGGLGILGVPLPSVETGIALSAVVLGLYGRAGGATAALDRRGDRWSIRHLPRTCARCGNADGFRTRSLMRLGFVIATGLLHLLGIGFGLLARWPLGSAAVRTAGVIIAVAGGGYLTGIV